MAITLPRPRTRARFTCEPLPRRLLLASGDPDPTFGGGDGRATISFPGTAFVVHDTALQADGKIIVAGRKGTNAAVTRLNVNGTVDTTFGVDGLFEYGAIPFDLLDGRAVAVGADGKIAVAGFCRPEDNETRFTVGRLNANGTRDTSFGNGLGIVRSEVDSNFELSVANDIAFQIDGKIVAAGRAYIDRFNTADTDMVVVRYNVNGSHDGGFADGDGTAVISIEDVDETAFAVALDYTGTAATNPRFGSIITAGQASQEGTNQISFVVARLNPNGSADNTFSGDGRLIVGNLSPRSNEFARAILPQPAGKFVVAGTAENGSNAADSNFLMTRFLPTGAIDATFGFSGVMERDLGGNDRAEKIAVNYHGGLVLGGSSNGNFALAAFDVNGRIDVGFNGDGVLTTNVGGSGLGLAATGHGAPLGRLVVAGGSQVARFIDVRSIITLGSGDPFAAEEGEEPAHFFVRRDKPLPFAERIFLSIGGTARAPFMLNADWTGTNIVVNNPLTGFSFVDILALETFGHVTITPFDDTRVEGDETAGFGLISHENYDNGATTTTTLGIADNDVTGGPTVTSSAFHFETPPQRASFTFNQSVSSSISAADFQVTGPAGATPFSFAYDAVGNTATLSFSGILPDGNYTARAVAAGITNGAGQPMLEDHVLEFHALGGDANRDKRVNLADFNILAINFGQSNRTFSQGDFNYDTIVNLADFNILASRFGTALAPDGSVQRTSVRLPSLHNGNPFGDARDGRAIDDHDHDDDDDDEGLMQRG